MIILNGTTESLQAVLAGAVATTQPTAVSSYADTPGTGAGDNATAMNGVTAVTVVAAPAAATQRVARYLSIYNGDTAPVTVTVNKVVSAVNFPLVKIRLLPGYTLTYTGDAGWQVTDSNGAIQASVNPVASFPTDYLSGFKGIWNSATSISVSAGEAYVPGLGRLSYSNTLLTLSSLSLTASTWYHVYLFENAGVPSIECVTTAPVAYQGTAYQKTGDNTRRYLFSVRSNASSNVLNFLQSDNYIAYLIDNTVASVGRILAGGTATTRTNVSAANLVPVTGKLLRCICTNVASATPATGGMLVDGTQSGNTGNSAMILIAPGPAVVIDVPLDASQQIDYSYAVAPTNASAYIDVMGYKFER